MRFRVLGLGIIVVATLLTSGCLWWRPCGCHHRCCYGSRAREARAVPGSVSETAR